MLASACFPPFSLLFIAVINSYSPFQIHNFYIILVLVSVTCPIKQVYDLCLLKQLCLLSLICVAIATCLPVVYYGYLQTTLATCSLLWPLPAIYYGYLQYTMATCNLLWLSVVYYGYLQSTMAIPVVYYGYTYSLPSVLPGLLCLPSLHYNSVCAVQSALPTQLIYAIVCSAYL